VFQIKLFLQKLAGIDIIKVFSLNAMATLVRMLAGMISVKVVAVVIGPVGIALLGQLNNFNTMLLGMANGGINNGITKYVAEYKEDKSKLKVILSNALRITLICSLLVSLFLIFDCVQLSRLILSSEKYSYVFVIFGFTIILYALNYLFISVLNGFKQFKKYVKVNISGTILGLFFSVLLVSLFGLPGALINAVTFQSVVFFVTLWMCRDEPWMKKDYFTERLNGPVMKQFFGFSLMTLTSLILAPLSQILLRGYVINEISASDAGIWEGMNHVSRMYLSIITTAFSIYYLPRLSEITDNIGLHKEIFRCYKVFIPMLLLLGITIYLLRYFILWLLYTPEFIKMTDLFSWQLFGDFFKICSWLLSFIMVAKAKTKAFITTEVGFTILYIFLSFTLLRMNGIVGLVQGYLLNYVFYMIAMVFLFRNIIIIKKNE